MKFSLTVLGLVSSNFSDYKHYYSTSSSTRKNLTGHNNFSFKMKQSGSKKPPAWSPQYFDKTGGWRVAWGVLELKQ